MQTNTSTQTLENTSIPDLLTIKEAAAKLRISPSTLKRLRANPAGPRWLRIAAGRKIAYSSQALNEYLTGAEKR